MVCEGTIPHHHAAVARNAGACAARHGMAWHSMARHGTAWHGTAQGGWQALPCPGAGMGLFPKLSCTPFLPTPFAGKARRLHNGGGGGGGCSGNPGSRLGPCLSPQHSPETGKLGWELGEGTIPPAGLFLKEQSCPNAICVSSMPSAQ